MTSPYQLHVREWRSCTRCDLHRTRTRVCFPRGTLPCDVLFVSGSPDDKSDVSGESMSGLVGRQFDLLVRRGLAERPELTWAVADLVACLPPWDAKKREPVVDDASVKACAPKLQQLVKLAEPRLVVCMGRFVRTWLMEWSRNRVTFHRVVKTVEVAHPWTIVKAPEAQKGMMFKRAVVTIGDAVEELS